MRAKRGVTQDSVSWTPIVDSPELFSSGIPDFDRLLGGGFRKGSLVLFHSDETVSQEDRDLLFAPTLLNFLYQSRGIIAVLPARDTPHEFRGRLTRFVTRRRFDSRVRVVTYVGEDEEAPYVVRIHATKPVRRRPSRANDMQAMELAERAVAGQRKRPFIEMIAFEVLEMLVGVEMATRMFFYGIKRARAVGNLAVGLLRPGLKVADAVRGMADAEFALHHDEVGLLLRGVRPPFPTHVVAIDPALGPPHVVFAPSP